MVKAYKALGKHDFATYDKNARQSRNTLIRAGVPEHHIREPETFINKTIRQTAAHNKAHQGPRICMQWHSNRPECIPGLSPGTDRKRVVSGKSTTDGADFGALPNIKKTK